MYVGEDYVSTLFYNVVFHAGMTNVSFNISIYDDNMLEGSESFILNINPTSLPGSVTVDDPGQATVMIVDDDGNWLDIAIATYSYVERCC